MHRPETLYDSRHRTSPSTGDFERRHPFNRIFIREYRWRFSDPACAASGAANAMETDMTYDATEIVDLGTASHETKGAPGIPFPDNYGDRPQEGLSDD